MAEGGERKVPHANSRVPEGDALKLVDPSVLTSKLTTLVRELEVETVMVGMKSVLPYSEVNAINAETNCGNKICMLAEYIKRRLPGTTNNVFNTFMKIVAGVQPDLFTTLAGRAPTRSESDFCVQNYVQATKEKIQASGHLTDSALDHKIDLDSEHVELAIVRDEPETEILNALPHQYQSHLLNIAADHKTIPVLEVLDSEQGKKRPKRVSLLGRAGTGKTTTMQWLARQWSLNKWANEFTMIFLIQLRMLSVFDFPMTAIELLTAYSLYRVTEKDLIMLVSSWIRTSTSKFLLFIDGLDEIGGFTSRLSNYQKITDLNAKAHPIDICLNIIQGNLMPWCTVVCASRPFTCLSAIHFNKRLEILGLTEARVSEFVEKKHSSKSDHIMSVLKESPLLMSVCSITFYCALISTLLADGVIFRNEDLQTYTRLITFLIVQYVSRRLSEWSFVVEVSSYFPKLGSMVYNGMFEMHLNGKISKLVFDDYDIARAQLRPKEMKCLQMFGLLQTKPVKNHSRNSVIAEFFHFSAQEMLASAYLISHFPTSKDITRKLFSGGQFNMALLYVFGLQYDTGSSWIRDIRFAVDPSSQGFSQCADAQLNGFLQYLCQQCRGQSNAKLQICQLVHESQVEDKAKAVAKYITPDGELALHNAPMTIIDLMAVRFVCKYTDPIFKIMINNCRLADTLTRFLTSSVLKDHDKTLHTLWLYNNNIGADGAQAIGEWLKQNQTLQIFGVSNNDIGENGAKALAEALQKNHTLLTLHVGGNNICNNGAKSFSEALQHNSTLQTLDIRNNSINENGPKSLAEALCHNNTLQTLDVDCNHIGDNGTKALAEALYQNNTLQALIVCRNKIGDNGAKALAETLCHNDSLQTLDVDDNNIGDDGAKALAEALHHNNTLQTLNIRNRNIGENGATTFTEVKKHNTDIIIRM